MWDNARSKAYYAANRERIIARVQVRQPSRQVTVVCVTCGESFGGTSRRRYCSAECARKRDRGKRIAASCEECGTEFEGAGVGLTVAKSAP